MMAALYDDSDAPAEPSALVFTRSLTMGGVQRQAAQICSQLSRRGWQITVVTVDDGVLRPPLEEQGIDVRVLGRPRLGGHGFNLARFVLLVHRLRPDVVYGLAVLPSAYVTLTSRLFRAWGTASVIGIRATDLESDALTRRDALLASLPRRLGTKTVSVISNSRSAFLTAIAAGHPGDRVTVVPNSIDAATFHPVDDRERGELRRLLGLPAKALVVGNVSRPGSKKGFEDLVAAIRIVHQELPPVMVAVAGLSSEDEFARRTLHGYERADAFRFLGRVDDMQHFYAALDLFVSASRFGEGFPNAIGEALCTGVRVVATDTGDSLAIAPEHVIGVPTYSPQKLAEGILSALTSQGQTAESQRSYMVDNYALEQLGVRTAAALQAAVDRDGRGAAGRFLRPADRWRSEGRPSLHRADRTAAVVVQRVLTDYRQEFFSDLGERTAYDLHVLHGPPTLVSNSGIRALDSSPQSTQLKGSRSRVLGVVRLRGAPEALRRLKPAVVVVEGNPRFPTALVVLAWCRFNRTPCLVWGLGSTTTPTSPHGRVRRGVGLATIAAYLRLSSGAIAYGQQGAAHYEKLSGGRRRVWVAPNQTRPFVTQRSVEAWHRPVRFLFLGRIVAGKRLDVLIRAWAEVQQQVGTDAELTIAGDGPERLRAADMVKQLALDTVSFIGQVPRDELASVMSSHHWFVMPGAGGLAAHEAMSVGTPVIAVAGLSGDGTLSDVLRYADTGLLASSGCNQALAAEILRALALSAVEYERFSAAAAASQQNRYEQMIAAFSGAMDDARSGYPRQISAT